MALKGTFGANDLRHFLLITLLLDRFAEPAWVVVLSSGTRYGHCGSRTLT